MSLTVTLTNTNEETQKPVAYRAIKIQLDSPSDDLNVITDKNGQFTIDEKYRNIEFILEAKYMESGECPTDMYLGGWQNWESDTLNIPVSLSSGIKPRSLGAGITVALKTSRHVEHYAVRYGPNERLKPSDRVYIPNPMKIEIQLLSPDPDLKVTTDRNGLFLIDEKYRNFKCMIAEPRGVLIRRVELDNNYVEMVLEVIPREWLRR